MLNFDDLTNAFRGIGLEQEQEGVVGVRQIGEAAVKLAHANDVYRITAREMKKNQRLLYRIEMPDIARKS